MSTIDSKVLDWFVSGETGRSSETMAARLTGRTPPGHPFNHPSDGGDLGRCLKLLDAVPELRERLPDMADVSPYWAALVERWDDLETAYHTKGADVYALMCSVLDPVEEKDRRVVRLGPNVRLSFGSAQ